MRLRTPVPRIAQEFFLVGCFRGISREMAVFIWKIADRCDRVEKVKWNVRTALREEALVFRLGGTDDAV